MGIGRAVPETKRDGPSDPSFEGCHRLVTPRSFSCVLVAQSAATPDWSGGGRSFATGRPGASSFGVGARMAIALRCPHRRGRRSPVAATWSSGGGATRTSSCRSNSRRGSDHVQPCGPVRSSGCDDDDRRLVPGEVRDPPKRAVVELGMEEVAARPSGKPVGSVASVAAADYLCAASTCGSFGVVSARMLDPSTAAASSVPMERGRRAERDHHTHQSLPHFVVARVSRFRPDRTGRKRRRPEPFLRASRPVDRAWLRSDSGPRSAGGRAGRGKTWGTKRTSRPRA